MRWYHVAAFLGMLAWQSAPAPTPEAIRRHGLSAMLGAGQYEEATFDCNGALVSSRPLPFRDGGLRYEQSSADGRLVVTAAASRAHLRDSWTPPQRIIGARMSIEADRAGFGFGFLNRENEGTLPSLKLRIGRARRAHFVVEVAPPTETYLATGLFRIGIGFPSGMVGLASGPDGQTSAAVDLAIPTTGGLDLLLRASAGPGHETPNYNAALGARWRW